METDQKHLVEFGQEGCVYVAEKMTLLDASLEAGVPLFHVCGGNAKCSTCRVLVLEGAHWLSPLTNDAYSLLLEPPAQHSFATVDLKGVSGVCQVHLLGKPFNTE